MGGGEGVGVGGIYRGWQSGWKERDSEKTWSEVCRYARR